MRKKETAIKNRKSIECVTLNISISANANGRICSPHFLKHSPALVKIREPPFEHIVCRVIARKQQLLFRFHAVSSRTLAFLVVLRPHLPFSSTLWTRNSNCTLNRSKVSSLQGSYLEIFSLQYSNIDVVASSCTWATSSQMLVLLAAQSSVASEFRVELIRKKFWIYLKQ